MKRTLCVQYVVFTDRDEVRIEINNPDFVYEKNQNFDRKVLGTADTCYNLAILYLSVSPELKKNDWKLYATIERLTYHVLESLDYIARDEELPNLQIEQI